MGSRLGMASCSERASSSVSQAVLSQRTRIRTPDRIIGFGLNDADDHVISTLFEDHGPSSPVLW